MSLYISMILGQALDPIKIIVILLITFYIKKGRVYYIFAIGGVLLGVVGIWLIQETNSFRNVNVITHMLVSIVSAHLLYVIFLLFIGIHKQFKTVLNRISISKEENVELTKNLEEQVIESRVEKTKHPILSDSEYQVLSSNAPVFKMNDFHKIIAACTIATIIGFFSLPYGYYILLKILFFGSLAYFVFELLNHNESSGGTLLVLIVLIILYNPIFPVELGSKALWIIVNLGTIAYLYSLTAIINKISNE